jgi:hypothetical protein
LGKFCQIYQEFKIKKQSLASFLKIEVKPMKIQVDIKEAPFYKWGRKKRERRKEKRKVL